MAALILSKTNLGTSRTPSPAKTFTKNRRIVGAGVPDSPLIYDDMSLFDKLSHSTSVLWLYSCYCSAASPPPPLSAGGVTGAGGSGTTGAGGSVATGAGGSV